MPPGEPPTERAATPEPTELEQSTEPTAPQPLRTSNRLTKAPAPYSQEQERETTGRLERRQRKHLPESGPRGSATTGRVAPVPDQTDSILRAILEAFAKSDNASKYLHQEIQARQTETSRLNTVISEMRDELRRRDEEHKEEIKQYKDALIAMQRELEAVKQTMAMTTTNTMECTCNGHYEELRAELQSLRTAVTSPSTGRSWASIASQSSVMSSNTRTVRTNLGLPAVVLDLRAARDETKALVDDPTQTREKIRAMLKDETATSGVEVVGVKSTSRTTVKVFVDSEESVANLRRATHWLSALPGAKLQGEQWFPVKLNDVKKESVYEASGAQREDFTRIFQEENEVEQVKKVIWLSGSKRYGSMAIYLSRQADAEALLGRRIAHVRGEATFSDTFHERLRPLRCRKCQQYNHKEDRCPNLEACGKCAGSHRVDQCTSDVTKCAACQGNHAVNDRNCPKWDEAWKAIRRREQDMAARRMGSRSHGSQ